MPAGSPALLGVTGTAAVLEHCFRFALMVFGREEVYQAGLHCGLKVLPVDCLMANTARDSGTQESLCLHVQFVCTSPISSPRSGSPTQTDGAFPRPAVS